MSMPEADRFCSKPFDAVGSLMRITTWVIPWLERELYGSMHNPSSPNKKDTKLLIRYDDYSDWLNTIIAAVEVSPRHYLQILDEAVVRTGGCKSKTSVYARHRSQSFLSVLRTVIFELIQLTEKWSDDKVIAKQYREELNRLLERFPERPINWGGTKI